MFSCWTYVTLDHQYLNWPQVGVRLVFCNCFYADVRMHVRVCLRPQAMYQ